MSTPIHVLLKANPCLENDVADDKTDPLVCLQLNQISVLQYFLEMSGSMTTNMCLDRLFFFKEVSATVVTMLWQTGKAGEWQVI